MLREGVNSSGLAAEWGKLSEEERKERLGGELGGFGGRGRQPLSQSGELDAMARLQDRGGGGGKPHNLFDQMFAQQRQFQVNDKREEAQRQFDKFAQQYLDPKNQSKQSDQPTQQDFFNWLAGPNMTPVDWSKDYGPIGVGDDSDLPPWDFNGSEGNVVRSRGNLDDGMPPSSATPEEKQRWFGEGGKFWDTKVGNAIEKYGDEGKAIAKVLLGLAFPPAAIPLYISAVKGYARDQAPGTRYSEAQPWMKEKFPGAYAGMYEKDLIPGLAGVQSPYGMFDIASGLAMGRPQDALGWTSWLWGNRRYFDNYGLGRGQGGTS